MNKRLEDKSSNIIRKVNLIDVIIVVFFLLLLPGGYYLVSIVQNNSENMGERRNVAALFKKNVNRVMITVVYNYVHDSVYSEMKVGDKLRDKNDKIVGEITKIELLKKLPNERNKLQLKINVLAKSTFKRRYIFHENTLLKVGSKFTLETERYIAGGGRIVDFALLDEKKQ